MKKFFRDFDWLFAYFLFFAILGWLWEVAYKYYRYHVFVNRGMNHLPWLPLYGFGSLIILFMFMLVKKKSIIKIYFISAITCSILEYFASWVLQALFGLRWWNYRNYFLNINGRVCLQSFLLFGLLGVLGIYLLVPMIFGFLNKIEGKHFYRIMPIIIVIFFSDITFSFIYPNQGKNITYSNRTERDVIETKAETVDYNGEGLLFKRECNINKFLNYNCKEENN